MPEYNLKWLQRNAMFSCQNINCAMEQSFTADMLKIYIGSPICDDCHSAKRDPSSQDWNDLPDFNPFEFIESKGD